LAKATDKETRAHLEGARDEIAKILDPKFAPPSGSAAGTIRIFGEQLDTCWPDYIIRP
jgi:hypothetical protein